MPCDYFGEGLTGSIILIRHPLKAVIADKVSATGDFFNKQK